MSAVEVTQIRLRDVIAADLPALRRWRNENRHAFFHTAEVSEDAHAEWFVQYQAGKHGKQYIVLADGTPIGTLAAIPGALWVEVSRVALGDKTYARTGAMGRGLDLMMAMYRGSRFMLQVRRDNDIARRFYEKHGFTVLVTRPDRLTMVRQREGRQLSSESYTK